MKRYSRIELLLLFFLFTSSIVLYSKNNKTDLSLRLGFYTPTSVQASVANLQKAFPTSFNAKDANKLIDELQNRKALLMKGIKLGDAQSINEAEELIAKLDALFQKNPLFKDKKFVAIRRLLGEKARRAMSGTLGVGPSNFQNNSEIYNPKTNWTNEFVVLKRNDVSTEKTVLYTSFPGVIISDPEPHFDGVRLLFSSIGTDDHWQLFEMNTVTKKVKQVTPNTYKDFDSFDGCYTADGKIIFCSTATFLGLPCTYGGNKMCGLFLYDPKTRKSRQLTYDQDSNWGPVMLNNGKILYQRWEYADLPHSNSRRIFTMNPDGTGQQAYYGSNSYFPTAFFNARPIPNSSTAYVGIAGGHHSVARSGRMLVIDPMKGREEAEGVVCEIPYAGRTVEPIVRDRLPDGVWPQFLQPFPLDNNYFVVSMKPSPNSLWGLYLVDTYNNMTLIVEEEGAAYIDPVMLEKRPTPQNIPSVVNPESKTATVFLQDVYMGDGLKGIPRGAVKKLRIGSYFFSHLAQGGLVGTIGMDGPWDIKRILGTVDVESDGSAMFTIPANTPVFVQPLDKEGKALQLMRSWFTGMPGETVSCVGCHESKNTIPMPKASIASRKKPQMVREWYGKPRGFSYRHEVQPVLDANCVRCHSEELPNKPYLKGDKMITDWSSQISGRADSKIGGQFSKSYANLQRYVRNPGIESDMRMLTPMEFHADQTELMQMLMKGHHGVVLDTMAIQKLSCWIDFNVPYHGRRKDIPEYEASKNAIDLRERYREMFAAPKEDEEYLPEIAANTKSIILIETKTDKGLDKMDGWPFNKGKADDMQLALGNLRRSISLGNGVTLQLIKIPAGTFIMGSQRNSDEMPQAKVSIDKAYWIGQFEITNAQYRMFDPTHDSRREDMHGYQFGQNCYPSNQPENPVVRISWKQAMDFCKWLSEKTDLHFSLPTEAQWEWACRAGSDNDFWFGNLGTDFSRYANLGDIRLRDFAMNTSEKFYESIRLIDNPSKYDDWVPRDNTFNDGGFLAEQGGRYIQNPWDLYDMHGNVWEWTLSAYKPYPYKEEDGRNSTQLINTKRVARGGSWYDRPFRATSSFRMPFHDYQKVFNVGFRIVMTEED